MKLQIDGRDYAWPEHPTFRQRRQAAQALDITVNELVLILTDPARSAEREEVIAALALVEAGENASRVLDLHPDDITVTAEPDDLEDAETDARPPASSPDDAGAPPADA